MAQINRQGNSRITGTLVGKMPVGAGVRASTSGLTPEQKAQRERETQAAYEVWRSEREARKAARYQAMRSRNLGL